VECCGYILLGSESVVYSDVTVVGQSSRWRSTAGSRCEANRKVWQMAIETCGEQGMTVQSTGLARFNENEMVEAQPGSEYK
jgi:hypothetical protein